MQQQRGVSGVEVWKGWEHSISSNCGASGKCMGLETSNKWKCETMFYCV